MGKVKTTPVKISDLITINVPCGPVSAKTWRYPKDKAREQLEASYDPSNWKRPISRFTTFDREEAEEFAYACDFYLGGHERGGDMVGCRPIFYITSRGYYHYVGA